MKSQRLCLILGIVCLWLPLLRSSANVYYVNAAGPAPTPPFASWATAATNIQDAVNLAAASDTVLVTNGVYAYGGLVMAGDLLNRVALTNAITVQSVNGPWVTTILGAGAVNGTNAVRCAWLTNGASLTGFTLMAGATRTSGDPINLESGGGVWCASSNAWVANCVIASNTASEYGGGIYQGTLSSSLVSSNGGALLVAGGATYQSVLNNCTIVSNSVPGVVRPMAMTNCIIYFNTLSGVNYYNVSGSAFSHCCTTPALAGMGNFTNAPLLLADDVHLAANSPCIGAGIAPGAGTDLFGNTWANPPSVGCAEWFPAPFVVTPPAIAFPPTGGVAVGVVVAGQPPFACWWTKNGLPVQNDANHSAASTPTFLINNFALNDAGSYQIIVSNSFGMATSAVSQVSVHCVASGGAALPPYSDWTSAATNIQDAINVAQAGDVVLVTNGLYAFGGVVMDGSQSNRVALPQAIMVQSVNGPWVTTIQGGNVTNGAPDTRCAWLTNGAALVGFALEGGATTGMENGAGVWCASSNAWVANCLICSNFTHNEGGGSYAGTLRNCAIYNNNSTEYGGGTCLSYLNNCTVVSNSANLGGGIYYGAFTNCIIYFNSSANSYFSGSMSYCCTYPMPSGGIGNITNTPQLFVDHVHLLTNSPCIGAGTNLGASTDIDGQPWLNPPSIGCSEVPMVPYVGTPIVSLTGSPAGFVATAAITGLGPWSCWWLENGTPLQDGSQFSGTQTASLTATTVSYANAGGYQLVVSNAFGVTTSAVAQVVMHCVNVAGASPVAPYTTWATAATNIQDAINASAVGDIVLVTNGIYASGGISMDGVITNRVSINKAILVQSVNGANTTTIQGAWDPATNGPAAVRCVWMTNNAILGGFTVSGGATRAFVSSGDSNGGGILGTTNSTAVNCVISNNSAALGGGGAYGGNLIRCVLANNSAPGIPGYGGTSMGGGAYNSCLTNCEVYANYALTEGGGTAYGKLANCAISGNSAGQEAGGVYYGTLVNCTVTKNVSLSPTYAYGGGASGATFVNSIIYANQQAFGSGSANSNYYNCSFSYSCTVPVAGGTGNIALNPQLLADGIHLASTSPCIGVGSAGAVSGTDIDGQPWNSPPSIGCDEWEPTPVIGSQPIVSVGTPPHALTWNVVAAGQAPFAYFWTHNGVLLQDNGHYSNSGTASLVVNNFGPADGGAYQVVITNASGAVTSAVAAVVIHAVNAAATSPVPPYSSWATAAATIQDAVNISAAGDIVLVTNGVYANGGLAIGGLTNRVALTLPMTVMSVNGFHGTVIQGAWDPAGTMGPNGPAAIRCAYVSDGALLNGFTLCNGATLANGIMALEEGGGIYCTSVNGQATACVLSNNSAMYGGGLANGTLNSSLVVENVANYGGGAYNGVLRNCTMFDNESVSFEGGGTYNSTVQNSIVLWNDFGGSPAQPTQNYFGSGNAQYSYSCSDPLPGGTGNIDVNPIFLDAYHMAVNSPCVGVGSAAYASGFDMDGQPWNNPPSMGCSEVVPANLTGPLSVNILTVWTNLLVNRPGTYSGVITGRASWAEWSFGDGVTTSNAGAGDSHTWTNAGVYTVTFTAFNNDNPAGVSANLSVEVGPPTAPQLQMPVLATNGIQFQFAGQLNANYTIQFSTNLVPPVTWQNLETINYNYQSNVQILDNSATNTTRFYRVLAQ